jgi:hypothetical protein
MSDFDELTDINEILEYLTTVGISHKYYMGDQICLNSEYCYDYVRCKAFIVEHYKLIYKTHENYKLLDKLFINCKICDKYEEPAKHVQMCSFNNLIQLKYDGAKNITYFDSINDLIAHMHKNHPECIRQYDIKIALK